MKHNKRRPILIGQAIEIPDPSIRPEVHAVLDNPGLYIGGDINAPDAVIPLWSADGQVHSMKLDALLDPTRFLETVTFKGPFVPESESPQQVAALKDALRLILPMAKGYAAEHPVGNNQQFIAETEALLKATP